MTIGITKLPGTMLLFGRGVCNRLLCVLFRPLFARCGRNVRFDAFSHYSFESIHIGDDVYIGPGAVFSAKKGLFIGSKVLFGSGVTIMGGDHNTSVVGSYMADVSQKRPQDDLPVVIEDDVWIGARVTILKGVSIGRGAIVGAGALVTKSIPPYAVAVGVPAKVVKHRWPIDIILQHEEKLYPGVQRLTREQLSAHMSPTGSPKQSIRECL